MNNKIAVIIKCFGSDFLFGGVEYLCYHLVHKLSNQYHIDILTEKCSDGNDDFQHIQIHCFNSKQDNSLSNYLCQHQSEYKVIILMKRDIDILSKIKDCSNICFVPFAHNTPSLRDAEVERIITNSPYLMLNTPEEKTLLESYYDISSKKILIGIWALELLKDITPSRQNIIPKSEYILYVGRVSNDKNFRELNEFFIRFKKDYSSNLKLVVVGKIKPEMELIYSDDIIFTGFISEEEKKSLLKGAKLLVLPSRQESLSIVILEAMQLGTPVLVNANCPVLVGQCDRSGAGLYYNNYTEFSISLEYLLSNTPAYAKMKESGKAFINSLYSWDYILPRIYSFIESNTTVPYCLDYTDCCFSPKISIPLLIHELYYNNIKNSINKNYCTSEEMQYYNFISSLKTKPSIVIVGAGGYGKAACKLLLKHNCNIKCITDKNSSRIKQLYGIPITSLSAAVSNYRDAYYIITPEKHKHFLATELLQMGVSRTNIDFGVFFQNFI